MTDVKNDTIGLWLAQVSGILLKTMQRRNVGAKLVGSKVDIWENEHFKL